MDKLLLYLTIVLFKLLLLKKYIIDGTRIIWLLIFMLLLCFRV